MEMSRRVFLNTTGGAAALAGVGGVTPCFGNLGKEATNKDNILVVIQLSGGNDGLNTVVPYRSAAYRSARPTLAVNETEILDLDGENGFHPSLSGMHELFENGDLRIVHGVGYEKPNRSHFESMDIWHSCTSELDEREDGWLGRYINALHDEVEELDMAAIHLGEKKQPLALRSTDHTVPSIRSLDEFKFRSGGSSEIQSLVETLSQPTEPSANGTAAGDGLLSFVQDSTMTALSASRQIKKAQDAKSSTKYPEHQLAEKLSVIAKLIDSGLGARIYYVELDGFDTHAKQADAHAVLLRQWSESVSAFQQDLEQMGHAQRICTMTFSEFGRRVAENASGGTDHGAAAPVYLSGKGVLGGVAGTQPSLEDLVDGDLKYSVDFRRVYASILENWFGCPSKPILGKDWEALPLFG